MKGNKKRRPSPLGMFAILSVVVAITAAIILILHNTYGFFA